MMDDDVGSLYIPFLSLLDFGMMTYSLVMIVYDDDVYSRSYLAVLID